MRTSRKTRGQLRRPITNADPGGNRAQRRAAKKRPPGPWDLCPCGHLMLHHDVEDMAGNRPLCVIDRCDQVGCRQLPGWPTP